MNFGKGIYWIARDVDDSLHLFAKEPIFIDGFYYGGMMFELLSCLFPEIKCSDGSRRVLLNFSITFIED